MLNYAVNNDCKCIWWTFNDWLNYLNHIGWKLIGYIIEKKLLIELQHLHAIQCFQQFQLNK